LDGKAHLINTPADVHDLLPKLREAGRVALDLETTGLDPREHRVRLFALATEQGTWLLDCFEVDPRPLFATLSQKQLVIHNALFDLGMLSQMGFKMGEGGEVVDTMLASQLYEGKGPEEETEEEE
jgi:ribonuclease D